MSALNVILLGDEAHLVTDGAAATFGVLTQFTNKALGMPQLGLAVGFRGHLGMMNRLRFALGKYNSQRAALAGLPGQLRKSFGLGSKILPKLYGFDIGLIGWRDGAPFARVLSSIERPGQPAFSWLDVVGLWASPPIDTGQLRGIGAALSIDLDAAAVDLVDAQRLARVVSVGGFIQVTTVNAKGISTRMLKSYPDMFLKKIVTDAAKYSPMRDWRN